MKKLALTLVAVMLIALTGAMAGDVGGRSFYTEDTSPAIRVKNIDPGGREVNIVVGAGDAETNLVVVGGRGAAGSYTNTLNWSAGTFTIADTVTSLVSAVNSDGRHVLQVDYDCALAADSTDDELLDGTVETLRPGEWGEACLWDTSVALFYSAYSPGGFAGGTQARRRLRHLYGNVGGTGSTTVNVYIDGTEVFERVYVSPLYILDTNDGTNTSTVTRADDVGPAQVDILYDLQVGASDNVLVRFSRATTGTTGGAGFLFDIQQ